MARNLAAAAVVLTICVAATEADASGTVTWSGNAWNYDIGSYPSVALGSNTSSGSLEVEVHEGTNAPQMWDHGGVYASQSPAVDYSTGYFPNVGADVYGNFLEVHQGSGNANGPLWYFLGHESWNGSEYVVSWPVGNSYANGGGHPSVAAWTGYATNDGPYSIAVEVHQGYSGDLWTQVGSPSGPYNDWTGISWGSANRYDQNGSGPSVAVGFGFDFSSVNVLEVHNGQNDLLWYHRGTLELSTGNIQWDQNAVNYGTGTNPAVAICADGTIVEVHQESNGSLNSFVGYFYTDAPPGIDSNMVFPESSTSHHYDSGFNPKVACDASGHGMEVHNGQAGGGGWMWTREFSYQ